MESEAQLDFKLYTVAWIAPLEIEARAARRMLDHEHPGKFASKIGDGYIYTGGDINGHNVVIATFPADHPYGTSSATALASDLREKFPNLWFGLLVGIAAGLPSSFGNPPLDIRLGDVLVALGVGDNPAILNYQFGKETLDGFQLSPRGVLPKTEQIVRAAIGKIKSADSANNFSRYYTGVEEIDPIFADPGQAEDHFYQNYSLASRKPRLQAERTRVWYGTIGSGDTLMKNAQKRDELRDKYKVIGLEMEAAGVMNILPVGVVRGVSDYGDDLKNKIWQPYAALTAAAYAKGILYEILPAINPRNGPSYPPEPMTGPTESQTRECLRSLSFPNIDDRRNNIAPAQQDTCCWLFGTPEFTQWKNRFNVSSHNGVLWIKGKPGSGKSTLMKQTLEYCQGLMGDYITAAYFFNARGNELEKTPLGMLRSLLFSLVDQLPPLRRRFYYLFEDKQKKHGTVWEWHIGELKNFLLAEMAVSQGHPVLLLIDALDECNEREVRDVVSFIERLSQAACDAENTLSICLSSRHYPTISIKKSLTMELETQRDHDIDIYKYVVHNLKTSDRQIKDIVVQKAAHIFMWVVLVVEMLNIAFDEGRDKAMWKKLQEVPSDLEEVYSTLLEKDNKNKQETLLLLQWVLFSKETLTPVVLYLAVLAGTAPEELGPWNLQQDCSPAIRRYITSTSRGLVEVKLTSVPSLSPHPSQVSIRKRRLYHFDLKAQYLDVLGNDRGFGGPSTTGEMGNMNHNPKIVQFIHYSVNDFLLRNSRLPRLDPTLEGETVAKCHDQLMACCMAYVRTLDLVPRNLHLESSKYPFLGYALTYTLYHAEEAQINHVNQDSLINWLQQPHGGIHILLRLRHAAEGRSYEPLDMTELLYYLSMSGFKALTSYCLQKGADINARGGFYGNALQAASSEGHLGVVQLLVDRGAEINAQGGHHGTALHAAVAESHFKVMEFLLDRGADINAQWEYTGTPLQAASREGRVHLAELLIDRGANVNSVGGYHGNALQAASAEGQLKLVSILLDKGADLNAQGGYYGTALQAASAGGHTGVVIRLVASGADPNAQGGHHGNALQAASVTGHVDIVEILLRNGADVNAQGGQYGCALHAAEVWNNSEIVEILLEAGASPGRRE